MFERFTDKARTAVIAARAEAAERGDQIRPGPCGTATSEPSTCCSA
jgi:hypothetical protein